MKSKPLTKAMRLVLERMEKGAVVIDLTGIAPGVLCWGDTGKTLSLVSANTFIKLSRSGFVFYLTGETILGITPAGRRALKEEKG